MLLSLRSFSRRLVLLQLPGCSKGPWWIRYIRSSLCCEAAMLPHPPAAGLSSPLKVRSAVAPGVSHVASKPQTPKKALFIPLAKPSTFASPKTSSAAVAAAAPQDTLSSSETSSSTSSRRPAHLPALHAVYSCPPGLTPEKLHQGAKVPLHYDVPVSMEDGNIPPYVPEGPGSGSIEVIMGPMFAGKSTALLLEVRGEDSWRD
jgi:hypothetical protein